MPVIEERLQRLDSMVLHKSKHATFEDGHCAMEVAAWLAGEPHSDEPSCVSPILRAFVVRWNDDLDDAGRQLLKPYLPRLIGTAGDAAADERRGWMAADWLVRVHTPAWLELAGITESAAALRALPELRDLASLTATQPVLNASREKAAAARAAARAATRDAAWDAAWAAAWDAARAATRDAAWDAARAAAWDAAWAAAWAAAWDAARAATRDAAWDAAKKKLDPTKASLQQSALELLDRMIEAR